MTVNYVIASWSGHRRDGNKVYNQDRSIYLKKHLKLLEILNHELTQITIVIPHDPREPKNFSNFIKTIPDKINSADVVVIRRKNEGQSYGSYSYAYGLYKTKFDYYIFIEDDYAPIKDNFDSILVNEISDKNGFLCSLVSPPTQMHAHSHAAISNGIAKSEDLEKIWKKYGLLPHGDRIIGYEDISQVKFSEGFLKIGTQLYDFTHRYRAPFNGSSPIVGEVLLFYGDENKEDLIIPLQFADTLLPKNLLSLI